VRSKEPRGETTPYQSSPYLGRPPIITPAVAVDGIVFMDGGLVMIRRAREPWKGMWALPGGFVEQGESCPEAVRREVYEETGLRTRVKGLFGVYSDPQRDPRAHIITIAYILKPARGRLRGGDDAMTADVWSVSRLPRRIAPGHRPIVQDLLQWLRREGGQLCCKGTPLVAPRKELPGSQLRG
jgi:8-oxo-dGTP diphosphatase